MFIPPREATLPFSFLSPISLEVHSERKEFAPRLLSLSFENTDFILDGLPVTNRLDRKSHKLSPFEVVAKYEGIPTHLNQLYNGGLCYMLNYYMLNESIYHFKGVGSSMLVLFYFLWKILLANKVDPDQMPHYVASDLGRHGLPITLYRFLGKNRLM